VNKLKDYPRNINKDRKRRETENKYRNLIREGVLKEGNDKLSTINAQMVQ
jgi:hypothetical protein